MSAREIVKMRVEALESEIKSIQKQIDGLCYTFKATENDDILCDNSEIMENIQSRKTVIMALKKQMPTKCIKDNCNRDCCPVCGWIIGYGDTVQPHCHNCGQALEWAE